ncbi:MAG: MFS transporter, partial [Actinomycetota bacterium]
MTVSLAGTLFFDVAVGAARPKVVQYLLITMTPFVLVAPVLGPLLDRTRGGRRVLFAVAMLVRALLCLAMAPRVDSLLLYPLAFALLVCSKGQAVAKSSLVPAVVTDHDTLVTANSRLAIIGVVAGAVAGPVAAGIFALAGPAWVLRVGAVVLLAGGLSAFRIPRAPRVGPEETAHEREVLHAPSIVRAGTAMAVWRGIVGFFTFFAAFALKQTSAPVVRTSAPRTPRAERARAG